jgi:hypothetical protein
MNSQAPKKLGVIHAQILELISRPEGATMLQLREILKTGDTQGQLDRRLRELDPHHVIERTRQGKWVVYRRTGPRASGEWDFSSISKKDRAAVLHDAHGVCQMCGKTIKDHGIRLHVDHKIPQEWGGTSALENLWAICSVCNEGKRSFFATFDAKTMTKVLAHESVHRRLLEALRLRPGDWFDFDFLKFVANFEDYQDDWTKRIRELRYFGLKIEVGKFKSGRRVVSRYRLIGDVADLPEDLSAAAQEYERARAAKNKASDN